MRVMRGARSRKAASMRRVHRSGGSNTCESDDRISIERPRSPERRDHVAREELEASRLELRREAAAVGRSRARAAHGRAGELRLALEERRETLPRLFDRTLVGRRDIDRNAE